MILIVLEQTEHGVNEGMQLRYGIMYGLVTQ